jgi:hypothetical protein
MLRYRAAAFWQRLFASHLTLGFKTEEEVRDVEPVKVRTAEPELPKTSLDDLNAQIAVEPEPEPVEVVSDELF